MKLNYFIRNQSKLSLGYSSEPVQFYYNKNALGPWVIHLSMPVYKGIGKHSCYEF